MSVRVGLGSDSHPLVPGRPLVLGGVTIPHPLGLAGHSDADALTHAVIDALLGAAGLGDIGLHFPPEDPQYKGADSLLLLRKVQALVRDSGLRVGNVDATIYAESPRLSPYRDAMRSNLAAALGIHPTCVNVKFKTLEGFGKDQAMAAQAVAALESVDANL